MSAPTVRRRRLGSKLRAFRDEAGLTLEEVAAKGVKQKLNTPKISRIESARTAAKSADVEALLDIYGVSDSDLRAALLTLTREGSKRGWWHSYKGALSPLYEDLISLEAEASRISTFQYGLIPGLLQTAAYAKEAISSTAMTAAIENRVDALVEVRLARQVVLTRDEPLELWAVIHESALKATCLNPATMRDQLQRLIDRALLPNVSIQVLPDGTALHPGVTGPFTILGFAEHPDLDVVHLESLADALYVEDRERVQIYGQGFERMQAAALSFEDSLALIAELKDTSHE
ncbi:helix-turn-helix domain-containing protein [Streptomyces sp. NPDC058301]|uniref:helix-turn-helix domain-containing protein n=1 Tax=Streptomyces sp. NPDC058301 TaxID=3346436 RepID=UPI0036E313B9